MNADQKQKEATDEALALRHVLHQTPDDRLEKLDALAPGMLHLSGLHKAIGKELVESPNIEPADVLAMLKDRGSLKHEAPLAQPTFESAGTDPATATAAYSRALENAEQKAQENARLEALDALQEAGEAEPGSKDKADSMARAIEQLHTKRHTIEQPFGEYWESVRENACNPTEANKMEAIKLDPRRGEWAGWFNCWMGPRCGLEPGKNLFIIADSGGGKTNVAAALAVDAMDNGCPVVFWQLELSKQETALTLMSQRPGEEEWWKTWDRKRANAPAPASWSDLLEIRGAGMEDDYHAGAIVEAIVALSRKAKKHAHACNGLLIVDYVQLLTMRNKDGMDASHQVLAAAANRITKAAAAHGVALVMLSQRTKEARKTGGARDTDAAGADFGPMPDAAVVIRKDQGGKDKEKDPDGRLAEWTKSRGTWKNPSSTRGLYYINRALVDEEHAPAPKVKQGEEGNQTGRDW